MVNAKLLFTAERLRLNPRTTTGKVEGGRLTIKTLDDRGYLTVDELQWEVLRQFADYRTVPDVLLQLIRDRKCPALKDFFELILKAHQIGVLQRAASHGVLQHAVPWSFKLPRFLGKWIGIAGIAAGLISPLVRPPTLSYLGLGGWAVVLGVGVAASSLALSLGFVLAAAILRGADGEVYRPRFRLSGLLPAFGIDLQDQRIMDRSTRLAIHLARLAPVGIAVAALAWSRPAWAFVPLVTLMGLLRPALGGLANEIIMAARGHPLLDTSQQMLFLPNRSWSGLTRAARQHFESQVVALRIAWGLLWIVAVLQFTFGVAGVSFKVMWLDWHVWLITGATFVGIIGLILLVFAYLAVASRIREPARRFFAARALKKVRKLRPFEPVTQEAIAATMAKSVVCQRLAPPDRDELATALQPVVIPARKLLLDFDQPAQEAWLIVSGAVDVFRRTPAGRMERAWQAVEGDLVGAENLVENRRGGWRLKARTPLVALAMSKEALDAKIVKKIEPAILHALCLRVPFLRSVPLSCNWHGQALARFATLSTMASFPDGDIVLRANLENFRLYMIYEGKAAILQQGKRIATATVGEFFGEIGMLRNSPTTAQVEALGPLTCLYLNKAEFLHFLSHNYEVALEVERVSSKRLGHPIFPLPPGSFDIL